MVSHVGVVAILMMVQAALELLAGILFVAMGVVFVVAFQSQASRGGVDPDQLPAANTAMWLMGSFYGGAGLVSLAAAAFHGYAGYRNFFFQRRVLGIAAMVFGLLTVLTCYCAPTAVALGIYGMIVYLNDEVGRAFVLGESGRTRREIDRAFGRQVG
jgi:hypothetical protein